MQIDQTGERDEPVGVDDRGARAAEAGAHLGDPAAVDDDVGRVAALEARAAEEEDRGLGSGAHRASSFVSRWSSPVRSPARSR